MYKFGSVALSDSFVRCISYNRFTSEMFFLKLIFNWKNVMFYPLFIINLYLHSVKGMLKDLLMIFCYV